MAKAKKEAKYGCVHLLWSKEDGKWILSYSDLPLTHWGSRGTGVPEQIGSTGRWSMAYDKSQIISYSAAAILKDAVLKWLDKGIDEITQKKYKLMEY